MNVIMFQHFSKLLLAAGCHGKFVIENFYNTKPVYKVG
jgi:hypothetical protein